jgi:gamma-tubulin complex component 3
LFSRLLTLPILNRKKEIILLLYHLSAPAKTDGSSVPQSPRQTSQAHNIRRTDPKATIPDERAPEPEPPARVSQILGKGKTKLTAQATNRFKDEDEDEEGSVDGEIPNSGPIVPRPSEYALLRDLPFTLQGLTSNHFSFEPQARVSLPPNLPLPIISLLHTLAEPSLLYRSLSEWVQSKDEGLISQSLRAAAGIELRSYLGLIATLEGEIRRTIAAFEDPKTSKSSLKIGVTLKRCVVWTRDATMGLRLMSLMAEESKSMLIISLVHVSNIIRQERRTVNKHDTLIFYIIWRSVC